MPSRRLRMIPSARRACCCRHVLTWLIGPCIVMCGFTGWLKFVRMRKLGTRTANVMSKVRPSFEGGSTMRASGHAVSAVQAVQGNIQLIAYCKARDTFIAQRGAMSFDMVNSHRCPGVRQRRSHKWTCHFLQGTMMRL